MGRTACLFTVILVSLALSACAANNFYVSDKLERGANAPAIVLMPVDVELSELTMAGLPEVNAQWTKQAEQYLNQFIQSKLDAQNIRFTRFHQPTSDTGAGETIEQLQKLHGIVGSTIALHYVQPPLRLPSKGDRFDWTLGPQVGELARHSGANYALFVFVRDSYSSAGRVAFIAAAALLGVAVPGGVQVGYASLVDLKTGDIVWYNRLIRGTGDLRTPAAATETVAALLERMPK